MIDKIDWKNAPEDATHIDEHGDFYYKSYNSTWHKYNAIDGWSSTREDDTAELSATLKAIPHAFRLNMLRRTGIERLNKACDQRAAHEYKLIGELSALRTQAIADAARIAELEASLAARGEALDFMKGAQQEWYEMYMQKRDAISRFKAGLVRAGARVPIDAMTMNANEQGLTAALVYLESELDRAAKRKYDLASIVSRGEQDDCNADDEWSDD